MKTALAALSLIAAMGAAAQDSEFTKPTVDFTRDHMIASGRSICVEQERLARAGEPPGIYPPSQCYRVDKPLKVKVKYVIHGYSQPAFFVEPYDTKLRRGWVYRDDITD